MFASIQLLNEHIRLRSVLGSTVSKLQCLFAKKWVGSALSKCKVFLYYNFSSEFSFSAGRSARIGHFILVGAETRQIEEVRTCLPRAVRQTPVLTVFWDSWIVISWQGRKMWKSFSSRSDRVLWMELSGRSLKNLITGRLHTLSYATIYGGHWCSSIQNIVYFLEKWPFHSGLKRCERLNQWTVWLNLVRLLFRVLRGTLRGACR